MRENRFRFLGINHWGLLGNQYAHQTFFGTECGSLTRKFWPTLRFFIFAYLLTLSHEMKTLAQHPVVQAEVQSIDDLDRFTDYEVNALFASWL